MLKSKKTGLVMLNPGPKHLSKKRGNYIMNRKEKLIKAFNQLLLEVLNLFICAALIAFVTMDFYDLWP